MSRFSGKCDFYDFIEIHGFDYVKNSKIYLGYHWDEGKHEVIAGEQLRIETIADCVPYYPHIISISAGDKESAVVYLTEKSWVDIEDERYGPRIMSDYYRNELKEEMEKYATGNVKEEFGGGVEGMSEYK